MQKLKPFALLTGLAASGLGLPAFAADAPASPHTFTANVGLYSQYVFRGLTQTNRDPAVQGGFDYSHASGIYVGTWASNISWLKENNSTTTNVAGTYRTGGSLEWDFYGGYKGSVGDFGYDVGLLQYYYPGSVVSGYNKANTLEAYVAGSWKWLSVKYSHSLNNKTFGVADSSGTYYLDFSANVPLGDTGLTFGAHYGIQHYTGRDPLLPTQVNNDSAFSYDDYKISLTYDLGKLGKPLENVTLGVAYTDTSGATCAGYGSVKQSCTVNGLAATGVFPKEISKGTGTVWVSKTF